MARIFYRSSAGLVLAMAIAVLAGMQGNHQGGRTRAVKAPGTRSPGATTSMPPATALQFTAASPTVENVHRSTTQPAHVEAYERTDLYAKASGFVAKVYADIGEQVEQDQILAELWIPEMEQEQRQKAALIEQARAVVEQAQARLASSEALIAEAEARLAEIQATIEQYEAEVAFRLSEHRRISELVASRAVTESLRDEKLKQVKASESALAAARAQVQSAQARIHVEHARKLQAQADVAHARSQLKVAETELRYTQILMQYAQIRAPYAGVITNRSADTGDL